MQDTLPSRRRLMRDAMLRRPTERIPTMPQICHDVALRVYETGDCDWIDGLKRCLEDPSALYDYVIRLVEDIDCDGLRLFIPSPPLQIERVADDLIAVDPRTGKRAGRIDTLGGGALVPDRAPPPVATLTEAQQRIDAMVDAFTDELAGRLREARDRVPDRFVASAPGGITMDTYTQLRGRTQAMVDLLERPEFVEAVMDMQAEAVIKRAEKLLPTGVDAFYIGDPSASGSLIGPWHFEQLCLPAYRKFCDHCRNVEIPIYVHVCGNSNPILEMLASTGAHVVEPLDPLGGVSVADAKRRISDKVALMGGLNTLTLSRGTPAQVRAEAIRKCLEGGPHGYILAAGDMVPPETPLANLQAMVDVATKSLWKTPSNGQDAT